MEWIPELKPPSGGLAAEGFYKLLGRPRLDPLTVLVRETAQNSWDARLVNGMPVAFGIRGAQLEAAHRSALREEIFVRAEDARGLALHEKLTSQRLLGLYITDRNTKGLGGPFRANVADSHGTYDWVDFVLNVGETNTQGHTGGTYGFGKTISYVVSTANAVLIHSRTAHAGGYQSRLIGCAIGEKFASGDRLYTGRHWWGRNGGDAPLPILDAEADRIARQVGMPSLGPCETGTSILVIAPDFGGRTPEQAMRFIAESVTWHLWPKLMEHHGSVGMRIDVGWDGHDVPIPRPESRPPLHGFAQAFQAIIDGDPGSAPPGLRLDPIQCLRPKVAVGVLATVPLIHRERATVDDGYDRDDPDTTSPAAAITGVCHHVALLRTPELVVDYLEGPPPPEGGMEWAGVFRVNDDQDQWFAAAEPPTHDSWSPELLAKSPGRTIVNVGLREIKAALAARWEQRKASAHADVSTTALVADELSHLIGAIDGRGSGRRRKESIPSPPGTAKPKIDFVYTGPLERAGQLVTVARVLVTPAPSSKRTSVRFGVAAALDGTAADADLDPALQLVEARVAGEPVDVSGRHGTLYVDSADGVELELVARRGPETTVLFDVDAEPVP